MKRTSLRPKVAVTADGRGMVNHAGARLLADLADATGLSTLLSDALAPLRQRDRGHDPGRVAVDLAVMLADGVRPGVAGSQQTGQRFAGGINKAQQAGSRPASSPSTPPGSNSR